MCDVTKVLGEPDLTQTLRVIGEKQLLLQYIVNTAYQLKFIFLKGKESHLGLRSSSCQKY